MWVVRDKREYDEPTVLNWLASDRARQSGSGNNSAGGGGYPTQIGGAAGISGSAVQQVRGGGGMGGCLTEVRYREDRGGRRRGRIWVVECGNVNRTLQAGRVEHAWG